MGENLDLEGRMAVRTPMQWTSEPSAGFSAASRRKLVAPFPSDGYGPEHVNVAAQRDDTESLYAFIRSLIFHYRRHPELGWGEVSVIETPHPAVLVLACRWDSSVVTVHNLAAEGATVGFRLDDVPEGATLVDLFEGESVEIDPSGRLEVTLDGYGFRWYRLQAPDDHRLY